MRLCDFENFRIPDVGFRFYLACIYIAATAASLYIL